MVRRAWRPHFCSFIGCLKEPSGRWSADGPDSLAATQSKQVPALASWCTERALCFTYWPEGWRTWVLIDYARPPSLERTNQERSMPRISSFYGIVIEMYYGDHPPHHFHARYGDRRAT